MTSTRFWDPGPPLVNKILMIFVIFLLLVSNAGPARWGCKMLAGRDALPLVLLREQRGYDIVG